MHAIVFAWAGLSLPWDRASAFTLLCLTLAVAHGLVSVASLVPHPRLATIAWRIVLWLGATVLAIYTIGMGWTGVYLIAIYGRLGQGMAAGALAATSCLWLFTLPMSMRAWRLVGPGWRWRRRQVAGTVAVVIAFATAGYFSVRAKPLVELDAETIAATFDDRLPSLHDSLPPRRPTTVLTEPVTCPPAEPGHVHVIVSYDEQASSDARGACHLLRADTLHEELDQLVRSWPDPSVAKIDIVTHSRPATTVLTPPWLRALALRAGADGACLGSTCLAPWQLVARNAFTQFRPIPQIPDLRLGTDLRSLYDTLALPVLRRGDRALGPEQLRVIETTSLRWRPHHGFEPLARLHSVPSAPTATAIADAGRRAQGYILRAQAADGVFRYLLDPASNKPGRPQLNVARQAGTTLALCELGDRTRAVDVAIERALAALAAQRQALGSHVVLITKKDRVAHLGSSALPLIAMLSCRARVGDRFDELIGELGQTLLAVQRDDGGFFAKLERSGEVRPGPDSLYAYGQAVMALVLLEGQTDPDPTWPARERVVASVERAMDHVSGPYWDHTGATFFFTEENWHCLAARAALSHHRHAGYERFCRDYVRYQARFLLDEASGVDKPYEGGHGFGNLFPPHNTPTAGLLEATAAAAALALADGVEPTFERAVIEPAAAFLLAQQWRREDCFACADPEAIDGAFSQAMTLPAVRIDYVQHAWAGLVHAGRIVYGEQLDLATPSSV